MTSYNKTGASVLDAPIEYTKYVFQSIANADCPLLVAHSKKIGNHRTEFDDYA